MASPVNDLLKDLCALTQLPLIDFDDLKHYEVCLNQQYYVNFDRLSPEKILISGQLFSLHSSDLEWDLPYELLQTNLNLAAQRGPWIAYTEEKKEFTLLAVIDASNSTGSLLKGQVEDFVRLQMGLQEKVTSWRQQQRQSEENKKSKNFSSVFLRSV